MMAASSRKGDHDLNSSDAPCASLKLNRALSPPPPLFHCVASLSTMPIQLVPRCRSLWIQLAPLAGLATATDRPLSPRSSP